MLESTGNHLQALKSSEDGQHLVGISREYRDYTTYLTYSSNYGKTFHESKYNFSINKIGIVTGGRGSRVLTAGAGGSFVYAIGRTSECAGMLLLVSSDYGQTFTNGQCSVYLAAFIATVPWVIFHTLRVFIPFMIASILTLTLNPNPECLFRL